MGLMTGVGAGMGEVEARRFAREGAKVIVADVLEEAGAETDQSTWFDFGFRLTAARTYFSRLNTR